MSGGVDSSVAAHLLKEQGYDVTGLFMSLGTCLEKMAPKRKACCSIFDARDAREVADKMDIPFSMLDFKAEFEELIKYFCDEYDRGRTPNPCIKCNQYLKFGKLLEYADNLGADFIATGHYARIVKDDHYVLKKGIDQTKDQAYVLFALNQQQLSRTLFPLGELTKSEVRRIAHKLDLPVKDKPESQDVCFVPLSGYATLLRQRIPLRIKPGEIRDIKGAYLGKHEGYQLYTIGQRHGLKLAMSKPVYVTKIIPDTNTVVVGDKDDVLAKSCLVEDVNWIAIEGINKPIEADVKIRYLHKPAKAKISGHDRLIKIEFDNPQPAITPGQAAVFYSDDAVLGGGWIKDSN